MTFAQANNGPRLTAFTAALIPRTVALFILLYQIRLLAADLADTPFFAAALAGALVSAVFLCRKRFKGRKIRPFQAILTLALVPWVIRFFIALPRWFIPGVSNVTIHLDSLLLDLDRNNFTALLPFYWVSITTYFSQRSRIFLRADIIAADVLFLVLFSIAPTVSMDAYRWPILMIGLFALVLFLQILSLVLSLPPELKLRRREGIPAGVFLFLLIFLGGALFIRPFQEKAVGKGGGLLEPKIFRFDFSQILRLESEISVNDDLVLIVKKDPNDYHTLLRRYTLSGYGAKTGFFRLADVDEAAHPGNLPSRRTLLPVKEIKNYRITDQEYYLVNFDSSAFIGMNMPVEITPFETWDASSFRSAYAVRSHTSEAMPYELMGAVRGKPDPDKLGLSPEEYALYTDYGGDKAIASFAREIIQDPAYSIPKKGGGGTPPYWEQIQLVYDRLKYGEYRYSLKPGIAPDGDQLKYFLFDAKKGYCSYYAFAFTLLLRSLGIPCRVAAGFFVDPSTETFNYYPVRADMAHAWAEVWFPGYGWIEYDPTTEIMAEGEEFNFSQGTPPELFERLMKEILDNHSRLREKQGEEAQNGKGNLAALGRKTLGFFAERGPIIAAAVLIILFLTMRSGHLWLFRLRKRPRKKAMELWAHAKRRLTLAGFRRSATMGEAEWAKVCDRIFGGLYSLYQDSAAARFAQVYTARDCGNMGERYLSFSNEYRKAVSRRRRFLAWLLPPLALILRSGAKPTMVILFFILIFSLRGEISQAQNNKPQTNTVSQADTLYENALTAQRAENWERAMELFNTGSTTYPRDFRFPWSLGNLYYHRRLYRLAWDEYRLAEKITSLDSSNNSQVIGLLLQLANTAGYLNRNDVSAAYLERLLGFEPDNREAIGSLAWMYFKLHRLPDGEHLLLDAIKRLGPDSDFSMTLGTIYSDMFQYQNAKKYYLEAIKKAETNGDKLSESLAHYNLSILETRFYQFSLANDSTTASLEAMERASGKLAEGELYLRRMELPQALAEYQEAYSLDSSPLSKLNLAQAFQTGGRLTEARLYAEDCLAATDQSWMLNYGIDPIRYRRDIHEVLKDTYEGLFRTEVFSAPQTVKERVQSLFRIISYRFRQSVHTYLFRKYSLLSANAYRDNGSGGNPVSGEYTASEIHLEALNLYFRAFEAYPRRALTYLRQARDFEVPLIPGSIPSYEYEEGRLMSNRNLLRETLGEFDPIWERDMIANVYTELALKGSRAERVDAAERLFALNRGALLQKGIRLPVQVRIGESTGAFAGILQKAVRSAGMEPVLNGAPRYTLTLDIKGEGTVSCELYDGGRGIAIFRKNLPLSVPSQEAAFARQLRDGVFAAF